MTTRYGTVARVAFYNLFKGQPLQEKRKAFLCNSVSRA